MKKVKPSAKKETATVQLPDVSRRKFIASQSGGWCYIGFHNRDEEWCRAKAARKELLVIGRKWMRNEMGSRFGEIDDVDRFTQQISTGLIFANADVKSAYEDDTR